ncbi:hypothetical protein [Corynebacterium ulceribovis]|uniref:hypothetical protein n=1 Tax=Corynebacterium ulceribovis TaxID=487732 RepID=UPI0003812BD9|nr:hypothetical protein [Corynebacterium ulceribovis]
MNAPAQNDDLTPEDGQTGTETDTPDTSRPQAPSQWEVTPDFDREWLEFTNPEDPLHLITVDLTWLLSRWQCVFGTEACPGIDHELPEVGCCTHGAFLTDEDDRDRLIDNVRNMVADGDYWQNKPKTTQAYFNAIDSDILDEPLEPWLVWDELADDAGEMEPALKTVVKKGACIFHNDHTGPFGRGCALHQWAIDKGLLLEKSKPEVCWQVPLRRLEDYETRPDDVEVLHTTITEYDRRAWGSGGEDFDWWCTSSPQAHVGKVAVYQSMESELRELIGDAAYDYLAEQCRKREAIAKELNAATNGAIAPSGYPLLAVHPATREQAEQPGRRQKNYSSNL